ncbi:MAG: flagellar motor switch protein FliN [Lentisphaerota bacterium]
MDEKENQPQEPKPANPAPQGQNAEDELAALYKQMEEEAKAAQVTVSPVELPKVETEPPAQPDPKNKDVNLSMILDIPVDVHVELGQTSLSIQDILRLGVGSIVELDRMAGASADIVVNGKLIGQGDVVVINENFGVRIAKLVDPKKRLELI